MGVGSNPTSDISFFFLLFSFFVCILKNNATAGNRTPINCLEGNYANFELDVVCRKLPPAEFEVGEKSQKFNSGHNQSNEAAIHDFTVCKVKGGEISTYKVCRLVIPLKVPLGRLLMLLS